MLRRTRGVQLRGNPRVYRQHVIWHRGPVAAQHDAPVEVQPHRLRVKQPRPGEARQRPEVDVDIVESVEAGDQARQHPRVGRMEVPRDDRYPHAGDRTHPQSAEHDDVAVAAAYED